MSNISIKDSADLPRKVDTFQRTDGGDTVETQAVAIVDPANGNPARPDGAGNLPVAPNITRGSGVADANTQRVTLASDGPAVTTLTTLSTNLGAQADAAATTDTGTFSLLAFIKRGLQNWTTLLARVPALVSGRMPVDGSGVTQPVSGTFFQATQPISAAALPLPAGAATQATLATLAGTVQTHDAVAGATPAGQLILAVRRDAATVQANADGDFSYLVVNEEGRLKTAGAPAQFAPVTGAIVAVAGTVVADVTQASNLMIFCTGTFAGVNCIFEGSINGVGGPFFGLQAVRSNSNTIETTTGVLGAAPAYAWELSVNALTHFQVRCTARTSGTQDWRFTLGSFATEPIPAAQISGTQPVSGTVTANQGTMAALPAGVNAVGDVGIQYRATATGAASGAHIVSAASTNATIVKASAGRVVGWSLANTTAAYKYVKLHNIATAPTAGAGVVRTIAIAPNSLAQLAFDGGIAFTTGIGLTITNLPADADTTAVAASDVVGDLFFA